MHLRHLSKKFDITDGEGRIRRTPLPGSFAMITLDGGLKATTVIVTPGGSMDPSTGELVLFVGGHMGGGRDSYSVPALTPDQADELAEKLRAWAGMARSLATESLSPKQVEMIAAAYVAGKEGRPLWKIPPGTG